MLDIEVGYRVLVTVYGRTWEVVGSWEARDCPATVKKVNRKTVWVLRDGWTTLEKVRKERVRGSV